MLSLGGRLHCTQTDAFIDYDKDWPSFCFIARRQSGLLT